MKESRGNRTTLTIERIERYDNDKDGNALVGKNGKTYQRVIITSKKKDGTEERISGFGSKITDAWKQGDKVDVLVSKNGEYWNFSTLDRYDLLEDTIIRLSTDISHLRTRVANMELNMFGETRE